MSNGSAGLRQAPNAVINRGRPSGWLRFSDGSRPGFKGALFPNASVPRDDGSTSSAVGRGDRMATFFAAANPGAATGDRLASLTRLSLENLTPLALRFVLGSGADYE